MAKLNPGHNPGSPADESGREGQHRRPRRLETVSSPNTLDHDVNHMHAPIHPRDSSENSTVLLWCSPRYATAPPGRSTTLVSFSCPGSDDVNGPRRAISTSGLDPSTVNLRRIERAQVPPALMGSTALSRCSSTVTTRGGVLTLSLSRERGSRQRDALRLTVSRSSATESEREQDLGEVVGGEAPGAAGEAADDETVARHGKVGEVEQQRPRRRHPRRPARDR